MELLEKYKLENSMLKHICWDHQGFEELLIRFSKEYHTEQLKLYIVGCNEVAVEEKYKTGFNHWLGVYYTKLNETGYLNKISNVIYRKSFLEEQYKIEKP